jgi:acetyl esterase
MTDSVMQRRLVTMLAVTAAVALAACAKKDSSETTETGMGGTVTIPISTTDAIPAMGKPESQLQRVFAEFSGLKPKPLEELTPAEARQQPTMADAVKALLAKEGKSTALDRSVMTKELTIPGADGELSARIYRPRTQKEPLPVLIYYHGGGFVIANKDVYDAGPRALAKMADCIVISVDYRLAPEHKFPAAHDDALATYQWVVANAKAINGDSTRVALGGESAGGNLAVATAVAARDLKLQTPAAIIAIYPLAGTDTTTPSYRENATARPLNMAMMQWFFTHATNSPKDARDTRLNLLAANVSGLPHTTVITAQIDPLRSEGAALADRLKTAGVDLDYKNYDGVSHEFFGMARVLDKAKDAQEFAAAGLKKGFKR